VISPTTLASIHKTVPDVFGERHPCWRALRITWDHVDPFWAGGTHGDENLVAACGACNFQAKGSCTLDELGLEDPRTYEPLIDEWDGLAGWLGGTIP
jgi:hypothetical protein